MQKDILVSIIIPVYNVFEWIDTCIESIVEQSYKNFEVLLIDDGSTDGSDKKCDIWVQKDNRIRYFYKKNEGPSIARNFGIQKAKGEYLSFVDSDDWVDKEFLQKMVQKIVEEDADFVECDIYRYNNETGEMTYSVSSGRMGVPYTLEEHMKYGNTAIWKCIMKKSLWVENGLEFPKCHSEARAVYPVLLALSTKIVNVNEALYYYRRFRKGSLTQNPTSKEKESIGIEAFEHLIANFHKCGLDKKYGKIMESIIKIKLSDILAAMFYRRTEEEFRVMTRDYYSYVERKFPDSKNDRYITLGGYNLNRVMLYVNLLHNPYCRFNFSSIISLMNPIDLSEKVSHKNRYREIMVNRDIQSDLWKVMNEVKPKYIFVDFLEERFDIIEYQGGYLTKSDAFDEAELQIGSFDVISRKSEQCQKIWEESCMAFLKKLEQDFPDTQMVLIKNYLSEKVGDLCTRTEFSNIQHIREINQILKNYYDFVVTNCNNLSVVETFELDNYFTDERYEYGAIPSHLNEIVNVEIAERINKVIGL